jgi:PAS domain S-box-containing protein
VEHGQVEQPPKPMLRLAVPVFDETGRRRGVFIINFLANGFFAHLQEYRPDLQHRLRVFNAQGYWLKAAQPEQEWGFMFPDRNGLTLASNAPTLWAQLAGQSNGKSRHAGGILTWQRVDLRQLVAGDPDSVVTEDRFLIIASEISGEEFGALFSELRTIFGILTGLLLVAALVSGRLFYSRRQAQEAVRRSEENLTVTLHSIGDAVLATDTDGRVTRMNPVAEKLTGWTQTEAAGRPVAEVFHIINEETRAPAVIPVEKVLATGEIQGLANHTIIIARDGTERPIADSAAPVRDAAGRILGVVLVFRDVTEERAAQHTLRASEARYRTLFDSIEEGYCIIEMIFDQENEPVDFRFLEISPSFEKQTGLREAKGRRMRELAPQHEAHWFEAFGRVAATGEPTRFQNRAEQLQRTFDVYAFRFADPQNRQVAILFNDITARQQAEEKLHESEAYNRSIVESSPDCLKVVSLDGRLLNMAPGGCRIMEVDDFCTIEGADWLTFWKGETQAEVQRAIETARAGGTGRFQGFCPTAKGSPRWWDVAVTPILGADGQPEKLLAVSRDITVQRQTEAVLADFKAALDQHAIVAITDTRGKITYVNDKFCEISRYSRAELIGQDDRLVNSGHHPKEFIRELWETIAGSRVWHGEIKNRAKDGTIYCVNTTIAPLPGADGKPAQYIAIQADVTKLKEAEESLQMANTELAQTSRLKDEFLANMSHELRTPLNAILGLSESLLEQISGTLTPRQVKSVTTISTSGQHLLELINDILDLSKIEAGKLELNAETLDLREFCESCLVFVRTQAMHKHIDVAFAPDKTIETFPADPKRFKQVLVNLLTNAVKFTPEGGRIGLTVAALEEVNALRFTVWDTGVGIAEDDQSKLFQSFSQIDSSLSRGQEGTGLGLALVAKLVELHGGSVTLESAPGQGSRFSVTVPRSVTTVTALSSAPTVVPDRRDFRRALLIEDDATSSAILTGYLTEMGISSILHGRGEEALETALREKPDVILLDILLPRESGWVVLARLQEHPDTRDIPVVVISVVDEPRKSLALGAAAHFTKPVTREQLGQFFQRAVTMPTGSASPFDHRASAPKAGPLILLAEDNAANRETLGGYLEDKGYRLQYAHNGREAVQMARELRPALILMDIQMPVMDGLTAIKELRADKDFPAIPIVALTALAMAGDRERCLDAGATDYMSKPVGLKALLSLVSKFSAPGTGSGEGKT